MAQRGGSVVSTVRFGDHVWSPVSQPRRRGHRHRAARGAPRPRPAGAAAAPWSAPSPRASRRAACCAARRSTRGPGRARPAARGVRLIGVDAEGLAREAGTLRAVNVALLGAASTVLRFSAESWQRALDAAVPPKILRGQPAGFRARARLVVGEECRSRDGAPRARRRTAPRTVPPEEAPGRRPGDVHGSRPREMLENPVRAGSGGAGSAPRPSRRDDVGR